MPITTYLAKSLSEEFIISPDKELNEILQDIRKLDKRWLLAERTRRRWFKDYTKYIKETP